MSSEEIRDSQVAAAHAIPSESEFESAAHRLLSLSRSRVPVNANAPRNRTQLNASIEGELVKEAHRMAARRAFHLVAIEDVGLRNAGIQECAEAAADEFLAGGIVPINTFTRATAAIDGARGELMREHYASLFHTMLAGLRRGVSGVQALNDRRMGDFK